MVAVNGGRPYSVDDTQGNTLREEIQASAKRASKRFDEVQKQRRKLKAVTEDGKTPPEHLRLVIVGAQWAAKSSAGNTILGKNAFEINESNKRTVHGEIHHGVVGGRRLTVVDSPGWFYNHRLQDSSEMDKAEIENSMYMCPPGPHAVLLVIVLGTAINNSYKRTVQEHMSLFTHNVWKHTIILFTRGDWLGVKTVEERIESEKGLQWLVNKCDNRYHVLNNMDHNNSVQVKELLEKIDEMIAGNDHPYYEVDQDRATQIEIKREAEDKKAKRIWKITERQSRILKELFEGERQSISDIRLVLLGQTESGKSTAGNTILLSDVFDTGFGTAWLKKDVQDQRTTATCVKHHGNFNGVKVTVVETPGWSKDATPSDWLKGEVLSGISMCAPGPHVFLIVVPISKAFKENDHKAVLELLKPFTERVWRHCMVLFTWGDWLGKRPVEDHIAREGEALQKLVEKCRNRYHVLSQFDLGDPHLVKGLLQKVINIITRNKGCFTTEGKQKKFFLVPWQRNQATLTEEEWNQREQTLIDRMLKALANEPDKQTLPLVNVANSIDGAFIPSMSGDVASDYGSTGDWEVGQTGNSEPSRDDYGEHSCSSQFWRLTVVDSPGWIWNHRLQDSCEMDKAEIENSMYMCPPGPHAVLLVIPLGTAINNLYKRTVQEHMSLFTDNVWKHTIILFTRGDWLGVKTVEERIESEKGLQWLVNKCDNRYHVLNNMDHNNSVQVKELLEKIDEMIAGNDHPYYEVDQDRATQIKAKREAEDKKAKRIWKITERQSRILKELFEGNLKIIMICLIHTVNTVQFIW
ncbi:GTPase IMAP family member 8-like [Xenentodon cancila]